MTYLSARRIIGGMTYNTATSTLLATASGENQNFQADPDTWEAALYRTRSGAFFEVEAMTKPWYDHRKEQWETKTTVTVNPLSHAAAVQWCEEYQAEILVEFFELPEEAGEEVTPVASIPLRMTSTMKKQLEAKAKEVGLSMNAFTVQCLEKCLAA